MLCRAMYSVQFAAKYFAKRHNVPVSETLPSIITAMMPRPIVLVSFAASYLVTRSSHLRMTRVVHDLELSVGSGAWFKLSAQHIGVGATCALGVLTLAYITEKELRQSVRSLMKGKGD